MINKYIPINNNKNNNISKENEIEEGTMML